ncbi:MAG: class I SAM-dependent methyltransferase [Myxococcales bacterium]|nr:class I SAM-dependent methyltransferase [Myxococcales bacterium]
MDGVPVNSEAWSEEAAVLVDSPLVRTYRRWMLGFAEFDRLAADRQAPLIDVGCGTGPFLTWFHNDGYDNLHGIEPDPAAVEKIPAVLQADVRVCGAEQIDFPDEHFDVVFIYCVLHHLVGLEAYRQACREVERILKPGGRVFIIEPGRYRLFLWLERTAQVLQYVSKTMRAWWRTMEEERPEQHFFMKNHDVIRQTLLDLGLSPVVDRYVFYNWVFTAEKPGR